MNQTSILYQLNRSYPGNYSVLPCLTDEHLLIAINPNLYEEWGSLLLPFWFMGKEVLVVGRGSCDT